MSFPQLRSKFVNQLTSSTAAVAYVLSAASGTVTLTGTTSNLIPAYVVSAGSGTVTLVDTGTNLNKGFTLSAASGSYVETGTAANFGISIPVDPGSYAVTGTSAGLLYNSLSADLSINHKWTRTYPRAFQPALFGKRGFNFVNAYNVTANSGSYSFVGTDANFATTQVGQYLNQRDKRPRLWPRPFAPSPWGHLTVARSANRISYATTSYGLAAASGSYALTGTTVTLLELHVLPATNGVIDWNVFAANLNKGQTIVAASGSFVMTSPQANFALAMPASSGNWIWTGTPGNPLIIRSMAANATAYTITGAAAGLIPSSAAFSGSYIWTGQIATLQWSGSLSSGQGRMMLLGAG